MVTAETITNKGLWGTICIGCTKRVEETDLEARGVIVSFWRGSFVLLHEDCFEATQNKLPGVVGEPTKVEQ